MATTAQCDAQLNQLLLAGQAMPAFEQFYADDVSMQENSDAPTVGKDANRERELQFFGMVEEFHGMQMLSSAVDGDVSLSEWVMDVKLKGMPRMQMAQVAVRRWQAGKVSSERFYYSKG